MIDAGEAADIAAVAKAYVESAERMRIPLSPRALATVVIARGYLLLVERCKHLERELEAMSGANAPARTRPRRPPQNPPPPKPGRGTQ